MRNVAIGYKQAASVCKKRTINSSPPGKWRYNPFLGSFRNCTSLRLLTIRHLRWEGNASTIQSAIADVSFSKSRGGLVPLADDNTEEAIRFSVLKQIGNRPSYPQMLCEKFFCRLTGLVCGQLAVPHVVATGICASASGSGIKCMIGIRQHVNLYVR